MSYTAAILVLSPSFFMLSVLLYALPSLPTPLFMQTCHLQVEMSVRYGISIVEDP